MLNFVPSDPESIGLELELQLIDATSLELVDGIIPLMELCGSSSRIQPELIQNTVEVQTAPHTSIADVYTDLVKTISALRDRCATLGMRLCGSGTHAFGRELGLITPSPKYQRIGKVGGYLSHTQITFATHIHIGVRSGEEAIQLMARLRPHLPLLLALSANSPFWRGYRTGFVAYRHRILATTRSYGLPPVFQSWGAFCEFLKSAQRSGVFQTINDIHWDLRPRPVLGTLELRIMDAQSRLDEAVMLANFFHLLTRLLRSPDQGLSSSVLLRKLPWWLEKENRFQASRLGLNARYVMSESGPVKSLRWLWRQTLKTLRSTADDPESLNWLYRLQDLVGNSGMGSARQEANLARTDSKREIVRLLAVELERETASSSTTENRELKACEFQ